MIRILIITMLAFCVLVLAASTLAAPTHKLRRWADDSVVWDALYRGREILGDYEVCAGALCDWMSRYDDSMPLSSMSIPGTHDTATARLYTEPD